ncbi:putative nicotinamide nucleotide transhydrogenase, subunit alpha 1 (A1) [Prochlorococcus marinus str. MIT 9313]|uniref:proton-translocating NAD(P)(+) transhydrogenase n=1 Tax=Prochlorococcus marinus (strain MIT 9313) TaxID=74547 RepID=Q7V6J3_PROMM|nr:Re/Si-specific NAD(P)(+) transhydrogenase subunit alpha [Prochlorococcus marinus]CAE21341.1 putative nicotinamide nucleotide transhydrogenase, subunit alpha 1 (A1) [Prochlorococcus marinus str. MIT 9313]
MPRLLIQLESAMGETRVAASPDTVKKFLSLGSKVAIERGAGLAAGFVDAVYGNVGAELVTPGDEQFWGQTDLLLCVHAPSEISLQKLRPGATIVGLLAPYSNSALAAALKSAKLSAMALELLPRISRAQSADALSSQANIAGYKAVLLAAAALDRYFPMLMTAAGTVQPARVVVLGAGVAGLQAVATAKRLGAVVYVSDVRSAVKEQVESLGARFIDPPEIEQRPDESGGYAKQASEAFLAAQREQLSNQLAQADVVICTAQVPGRKAPRLISDLMLDRMRPGAVVVDLAVEQGGNCANTRPGETVDRNGVKLIGASDLPCSVPNHASALYSRNLVALLEPVLKDGQLSLNIEDELIAGCLISHNGEIRHNNVFNMGGSN